MTYMVKDIASHCYIAVHFLHQISKLINQENKLRQINYFQKPDEEVSEKKYKS